MTSFKQQRYWYKKKNPVDLSWWIIGLFLSNDRQRIADSLLMWWIQNRCIKALYHLHRFTSTTFLYSASILPVEKLAVVERVTYIHKIVNSLTKNNFDIRFNYEIHSHRTRQANQLHCPDNHPALKQSTIEYNKFCGDLRDLRCIKSFKAKVKTVVLKDSDQRYNVISPYVFLNWCLWV